MVSDMTFLTKKLNQKQAAENVSDDEIDAYLERQREEKRVTERKHDVFRESRGY